MDEAAPADYSRLSGTSGAKPTSPASDAPGSTQEVLTQAAKEAGVDPSWAQSPALDSLLNAESSSSINGPLNTDAENPSGAYGIGQLMPDTQAQYLPEGADPSDPVSQATAMMSYIKDRYGSPEAAWNFHQSNGWY
jgi:SLT domain-containing protein